MLNEYGRTIVPYLRVGRLPFTGEEKASKPAPSFARSLSRRYDNSLGISLTRTKGIIMNQAIATGGTVIGIFDKEEVAMEAIRNLKAAGFDEVNIGIAARSHEHPPTFGDGSEKMAAVG